MQIKAVILDLDGLIVDSEPLHQRAFNQYLARHHIEYAFDEEEYGKCFVGIPVRANAEYLISRFDLPCNADELLKEREALFEELIGEPANLIPMPGLFQLLGGLERRGILLAVASASPRQQVTTMLQGLGIAGRFRVVVTATDVIKPKPAPDVYLLAIEKLGVPKESAVAVEDSATGVAAAKAAGLRVIGVPNRYTRRQQLNADSRVQSLHRVIELIG